MSTVGRKMFGKSGTKSIALAEIEGLDTQVERLNFLWTGKKSIIRTIPALAKNRNYAGDIRYIRRLRELVSRCSR